jgi:hypothetical protein
LDRNRGLASAKLPSLAIVTGAVQVVSNDDLRAIAFPLVTSVGDGSQGFVIGPNAILDDLSPPASTVAVNGLVQVSGNPALPTCMAKAFAMACVSTAGTPIVMGNKADACGQ